MKRSTAAKEIEDKAWALGADRVRLRKRLLEARSALLKEYRDYFTPIQFDFKYKCLWSRLGNRMLQWRLRQCPYRPVSVSNQQTSVGIVVMMVEVW